MKKYSIFFILLLIPLSVFARQNQVIQNRYFNDANLKAYWRLEDTNDSKSTNTLVNTSTVFSAGIFNNAANFGTSGQTRSLATNGLVGGVQPMTATAYSFNYWVNVQAQPSVGTVGQILEYKDSTTVNHMGQIEIQYLNNGGTPQLYLDRVDSAGMDRQFTNFTLTTSQWYMVTVTYDGANARFYLSTGQNATTTALLTDPSVRTGTNTPNECAVTGIWIGQYCDGSRELWGLFDDYSFYNRVLSTADIANLYTFRSVIGNGISR